MKLYPEPGLLRWAKALQVLWRTTKLPCSRLIAPSPVNTIYHTEFLLSAMATYPTLAPAVIQPRTSFVSAVRVTEGEDQGYQSGVSTSTVSFHNEPLSPHSNPKSNTSSMSQVDTEEPLKGVRHYEEKLDSDFETGDSPTGMYIFRSHSRRGQGPPSSQQVWMHFFVVGSVRIFPND